VEESNIDCRGDDETTECVVHDEEILYQTIEYCITILYCTLQRSESPIDFRLITRRSNSEGLSPWHMQIILE
jgi:hypothetical protein